MGTATSTCPACGANAFALLGGSGSSDGAGTCARCGFASGEANRCPHCKVVARIDGIGLRAVCAMCGGPRIPTNLGGDVAQNALREQQRALTTARVASIATVLQAATAAVATAIGLAIRPASIVGNVVLVVIAVLPLILALRSRFRAAKARANAAGAAERAWQAAAEDLAARTAEGVTVPGLAGMLGIDPAHAERLLTSLTVHDRTRIDVGDDAEVRYSARPDELPLPDEELAAGAKTLEGSDRPR